jgi:hypothetical protein
MDDKNWRFAVVGNIVKQHLDDEGVMRYGTKAFTGGTKVYLCGKGLCPDTKTVEVIGLNRFHKYVIEFVPVGLIENVRFQTIHKRGLLNILNYEENIEGWNEWKRTADDKREAQSFAKTWNEKFPPKTTDDSNL